jgi:hypothetical protein
MANRDVPPTIKALDDGHWRVVVVPGFQRDLVFGLERQFVAVLQEIDTGVVVERTFPVSLLPLFFIGATFDKGDFRPPAFTHGTFARLFPATEVLSHRKAQLAVRQRGQQGYSLMRPLQGSVLDLLDRPRPQQPAQETSVTVAPEQSTGWPYRRLPLHVFRWGDRFIVIPTMEIIRYYYAALCSSVVMRRVCQGQITSNDNLDSLVNLSDSTRDRGARRVFVVLRKQLVQADRLVVGHLYYRPRGRYARQADRMIDSLLEDSQRVGPYSYPAMTFPFASPTPIRFDGSLHELRGKGGKPHPVYLVHRILKSKFHLEMQQLDFNMDNRNDRLAIDPSDLPPGWSSPPASAPVDPSVQPVVVPPDEGGANPALEIYNFFLAGEVTGILETVSGDRLAHKPQKTRHVVRPEEPGVEPDQEPTVSTEDETDDQKHHPGEVRPDESPGPGPVRRLSTLEDLKAVVEWITANHRDVTCTYPLTKPIFPLSSQITKGQSLKWLVLPNGGPRRAMLVELNQGSRWAYILEVDKGSNSLSALVFHGEQGRHLTRSELTQVLDELVRIRGIWASSVEKNKPRLGDLKLTLLSVHHIFTEIQAFATAVLKSSGLWSSRSNETG